MAAREAYFLYVERAAEGANEADGPFPSPYAPKNARTAAITSSTSASV